MFLRGADLADPADREAGRLALADAAGLDLGGLPALDPTDPRLVRRVNDVLWARPEVGAALQDLRLDGIGQGELLLYLLVDGAYLGDGVDLWVGGEPWVEAKGGAYRASDRSLTDVKLGGDAADRRLVGDLVDLNRAHAALTGRSLAGWGDGSRINASVVAAWRALPPLVGTRHPLTVRALQLTPAGDLLGEGGEFLGNVHHDAAVPTRLRRHASDLTTSPRVPTLAAAERAWAAEVERTYLAGKRFALFSCRAGRLQMHYLGPLAAVNMSLHRVTRGLPHARIDLNGLLQPWANT